MPTGGTITTSGNYTIHTFTSSGTLTITEGDLGIEYLVVAGGGGGSGGAANVGGGGGGGGGLLTGTATHGTGSYTVTVGGGGAAGLPSGNGGNSVFNTITATGGGGGGGAGSDAGVGHNGGSGGGGTGNKAAGTGVAGQGYAGGLGTGTYGATVCAGGGGGGAGGVGGNSANTSSGGAAGAGASSSISGASVTYSNGGAGAPSSGGAGAAVTANTGRGGNGGAGNTQTGSAGATGIVIIRYSTVKYWIGGTGNWSDTAHWSASSGGTGGAAIPTSTTNVFIDANSGFGAGGTISLDGAYYSAVCHNFTSTSGHNYIIDYVTSDLSIYGSYVGESGLTWQLDTWTYFLSDSSETITAGGGSLYFVYFGYDDSSTYSNGTWTLQDDLVVIDQCSIYDGTFDANDHDITALEFGIYSGATVSMGSGTWELTHVFYIDAGATINAETSTIKVAEDAGYAYIYVDGYTLNNLSIPGNGELEGVGAYLFSSVTYNQITAGAGVVIYFAPFETTTATDFNLTGTSGLPVKLISSSYAVDDHQDFTNTEYVSLNGTIKSVTQSFHLPNEATLDTLYMYCGKTGSPTGSLYVKIYAHSGTYGTSSVPIGSALATSDAKDVSTIPSSGYSSSLLAFTGENRITLESDTDYIYSVEYTGDVSNYVRVLVTNSTSATHSGNYSSSTDLSSWTADSTKDLRFSVYGVSQHILSQASGTVDGEYLDISHSNATGGATWRAFNSTDSGNNTGWLWSAQTTPAVIDMTFTLPTPTITEGIGVSTTPDAISLSFTLPDPFAGGMERYLEDYSPTTINSTNHSATTINSTNHSQETINSTNHSQSSIIGTNYTPLTNTGTDWTM